MPLMRDKHDKSTGVTTGRHDHPKAAVQHNLQLPKHPHNVGHFQQWPARTALATIPANPSRQMLMFVTVRESTFPSPCKWQDIRAEYLQPCLLLDAPSKLQAHQKHALHVKQMCNTRHGPAVPATPTHSQNMQEGRQQGKQKVVCMEM